jgi:hypothetical protein
MRNESRAADMNQSMDIRLDSSTHLGPAQIRTPAEGVRESAAAAGLWPPASLTGC